MAREGVRSASLDHVLDAVSGMHPGPGQGCFVFATSHGALRRGFALVATDQILDPDALDRALVAGCGNAPTVVVISACFPGSFAVPPMVRANRVILTAARADRASFGCGAGREFTVFDRELIDALRQGGDWEKAYDTIRFRVAAEEKRQGFPASEPQAWFGPAVMHLPVPAQSAYL